MNMFLLVVVVGEHPGPSCFMGSEVVLVGVSQSRDGG